MGVRCCCPDAAPCSALTWVPTSLPHVEGPAGLLLPSTCRNKIVLRPLWQPQIRLELGKGVEELLEERNPYFSLGHHPEDAQQNS